MLNLKSGKEISFKDPEISKCPWEAYDILLEQAPVYFDRGANIYVVTRYEDIRSLLKDNSALTTLHATEKLRGSVDPERDAKIRQLFIEKGWPRERPVGNYEGEEHKERRAMFERFLRAGKIKDYEPMIRKIANDLVDKFIDDGECELVSQFSERYSLLVICGLVGAPEEAIDHVKASVDAMLRGLGMAQTEEQDLADTEIQIRAQHFFKGLIDKYRDQPDDSILGQMLNTRLPSGAEITDAEMMMHIMLDLFFAGAETTAKAITSGIVLLESRPDIRAALEEDLAGNMRTLCEEVLRVEPPFTGNIRVAIRDIDLHGVTIPEGSVVQLRLAAGNRDARQFTCPADIDLERSNAAQHLSFGSGDHACVGAPLARRELQIAFETLFTRLKNIRVAEGQTVEYEPSLLFRGIPKLRVTFERR